MLRRAALPVNVALRQQEVVQGLGLLKAKRRGVPVLARHGDLCELVRLDDAEADAGVLLNLSLCRFSAKSS